MIINDVFLDAACSKSLLLYLQAKEWETLSVRSSNQAAEIKKLQDVV